jgi:hypothetical protein
MKTFTTFCREKTGRGTVWIASVEAEDLEAAKVQGRADCAADWDWASDDPEEDMSDDIEVIGVAEGNINILYWNDQS